MKVGRYGIAFGRVFWLQTKAPTRIWHFLCFWIFKEVRPQDVDREQQFPIGTRMSYRGRKYRYLRAGEELREGSLFIDQPGSTEGCNNGCKPEGA